MKLREFQLLFIITILVGAFLTTYKLYEQHKAKQVAHLERLDLEYEDYHVRAIQCRQQLKKFTPQPKTEMLILIITAPSNFEFRSQLRNESYLTQKWKYATKDAFAFRYHFVCGNSHDIDVQSKMKVEQSKYNDVLIGDFVDNYENLVYKTIWLLRYAVERYEFEFVLKVDDDTFLNLQLLFDFLNKFIIPKYNSQSLTYYGGMIRHGPRDVQRDGQWGIEVWEFAQDILPPYLVGGAYIMNRRAAKQIADLTAKNELVAFRIEDAYIGALANKLGIVPRDIPKTYSKEYDRNCLESKGKIFHRVAPSFQKQMIANWTTYGYYCKHSRSHEELVAAGEELARKY